MRTVRAIRLSREYRRHPDKTPPEYYLGYGDKYIYRFRMLLYPILSPAGKQWLERRANDSLQFGNANYVVNDQEIWSRGTGENSILCSSNGGRSWTTLRVPGRGGIATEKMGHIGLRRVTLYGDGLLVTRDKGASWTAALPQSLWVYAMDGEWLVARIGFEIKFGRLNAEDKVDWQRTLKFGDVHIKQLLVTDQGHTLRMLGSYEPPPVNPIVVFESHDGGAHFSKTNLSGCSYPDTATLTRDGGGVCLTAWEHDIKVPRNKN